MTEIKGKILKGIEKAIEKLITQKKKIDGDLVISKDGNIEAIKANEI